LAARERKLQWSGDLEQDMSNGQCVRVAGALAFLGAFVPAVWAHAYVRQLPSAPTAKFTSSKHELRKVILDGNTVTLVDVLTGTDDWSRPDPAHLRTDKARLAPALRGQFQRFYGGVVGWMLVPAGWHLQFVAIGADGNSSYTFVAPQGAVAGWLDYGVTPACVSCLLGSADGLLPGAWEQEVAIGYVHGSKPWRPVPTPSRFDHPNACTALLRYRSGGLTVFSAMLSSTPMDEANRGNTSLAEVYAALPSSKAALAQAIVASLQHNYPACQGAWSLAE